MILVSIFSLRNKNAFRLSSFFYSHFKKFGGLFKPVFFVHSNFSMNSFHQSNRRKWYGF
ncbi:hypothetical protein LEP1GSC103_1598 [Leptospira borgpetersenii serovar Javanica str. UI 09931]|uniref:Uncharacterized protein n=5 Tax=Leptospira borgpetersenii TaxID=174 RepID=M3GUA2_LEPBO|nr:hypothetical protein LBBP_01588 [Leptospira borgpetersenii serovar Ballum]EKP12159.1 hypothetical protein LEP1GSC128_0271 [Leptospira borgpetersenii str. 200801926]EKQ90822.1 hypothetical protein LEP1GSC101_1181 [Leptospira borgpetersenii str. UI 09149]EKR00540.1 hypothetical protein LEP1GSC121_1174 [Leptospira borgpetersenii serovar Castellonis str. 200801910]EMF98418.1 hypothetical protein LEP1GSC123_1473 [Leptospira borgpetersenii str. 200701203]EMK09728.1 hypothetical protein LEP1GSC066